MSATSSRNDLDMALGHIAIARNALAALLGVSVPTIREWRRQETPIPDEAARTLRRLCVFADQLVHRFGIDDVGAFLESGLVDQSHINIVKVLAVWETGTTGGLA